MEVNFDGLESGMAKVLLLHAVNGSVQACPVVTYPFFGFSFEDSLN
jgi:hypothetical protein